MKIYKYIDKIYECINFQEIKSDYVEPNFQIHKNC